MAQNPWALSAHSPFRRSLYTKAVTAWILLASLFAGAASANRPVGAADPVARGIEAVDNALRGTSDETVLSKGHALQDAIQGGWFVFRRPSIAATPRPVAHGETINANELVEDAQKRLIGKRKNASSELKANVDGQSDLVGQGRIRMVDHLADNTMGVYKFAKDRVQDGFIELNSWLRQLAQIMPLEFLEATLVHEKAHQGNAALATEGVIDGEIVSFSLQYEWLAFVDPTGEKLGMLRLLLEEQMRAAPNALTRKALEYAAALDVLRGTGGERRKIREYVEALGYREGQDRHAPGDGHDHGHDHGASPSA